MHYYFSRGYRIEVDDRLSEGTDKDSMIQSGEPSVNALNRRLVDRNFNPESWVDVSAVLEQAILLFGGFKNWVLDQLRANTRVFGHRAEYLVDTVGFILNGKRYMTNESWLLLISGMDAGATVKTPLGTSVDSLLNRLDSMSDEEILQAWASNKSGVIDLIDALFIFFGHHIQSDMREPI